MPDEIIFCYITKYVYQEKREDGFNVEDVRIVLFSHHPLLKKHF